MEDLLHRHLHTFILDISSDYDLSERKNNRGNEKYSKKKEDSRGISIRRLYGEKE